MRFPSRSALLGLIPSFILLQCVHGGSLSWGHNGSDPDIFRDVADEMPLFTNLEDVFKEGEHQQNDNVFTPKRYPDLTKRAMSLAPATDPFNKPPKGYERHPPGTILQYRLVARDNPPLSIFDLQSEGQLLDLVSNNDTYGNPPHIVVSVFIPYNADYSKIVSYHMAEDDVININCSPSYTIHINAPQSPQEHAEFMVVKALLNRNWIMIIPDYDGPQSSFCCAILEAHAILDGTKAVLLSGPFTSIKTDADVILGVFGSRFR